MQWYLISNCNNIISYKLKAKLLWMRKIAAMCVLPWQMGDTSLFNPWDPLSINCERLEIVRFLLDSFWTFPKKVTDKKQTKREYFLLDINNRVKLRMPCIAVQLWLSHQPQLNLLCQQRLPELLQHHRPMFHHHWKGLFCPVSLKCLSTNYMQTSPNVCQLRLDFDEMEIQQPDPTTHQCTSDRLPITLNLCFLWNSHQMCHQIIAPQSKLDLYQLYK